MEKRIVNKTLLVTSDGKEFDQENEAGAVLWQRRLLVEGVIREHKDEVNAVFAEHMTAFRINNHVTDQEHALAAVVATLFDRVAETFYEAKVLGRGTTENESFGRRDDF